MTGRERVRRALRFERPDRAPRELWTLPGVPMFHQADLTAVLGRFPQDFTAPEYTYGPGRLARGTPNVVGTYVDEWGCPFRVAEPGVVGEVKAPPLARWADLDRLRPPDEILTGADLSRVNPGCGATDLFVKAPTTIRPFERMQFLRGTENLFMDLAWGTGEAVRLRDIVHEFYLRELELWLRTDVDGIAFMDDWGTQTATLVSPALWRSFFKPLYADYVARIHAAGKFAFFHSDGHILPLLADLVEVGVDALNAQLFCMDIEEVGRRFKGRITFWGEIDRQWVLPFGSPSDVAAAVRRVRSALDDGTGGVIAECEWGMNTPRANIESVFEAWL